ncbi:MAG: DUF4363 family protein [Oscillospiraceae bacterium]|nr:DUF4363 family protein [Oscillospiraceae bacterium]
MKKEFFAAALLIALSAGSAANLRFLRAFTRDMTAGINDAYTYAQIGQWDSAAEAAEKAEEMWVSASGYTRILIRHTESDGVSEAFCDFLGAICAKDPPAALQSGLILKQRLSALYDMERPTLGSIL